MTVADQQMRAALMLVPQHFTRLGLDLPDGYTDALERIDQQLGNRDALTHDPARLAEAVAAALATGKDPAADKAVTAELTRAQLHALNIGTRLDGVAADRRAAVLHQHADALLERLAAEVTEADAILADARNTVPDLARVLADHHGATRLRPDRLAAWGSARDAVARLGVIVQTWTLIVQACGLANPQPKSRDRLLILADLDLPALDRAARDYGTDPTAAAIAGHRLELATPATYAERVDKIAKQRAELQRAHDERSHQAMRQAAGAFRP
jgi:hypothetical protein